MNSFTKGSNFFHSLPLALPLWAGPALAADVVITYDLHFTGRFKVQTDSAFDSRSKPLEDLPKENTELTTTIVANVPSDPRLAFWSSRVKKKVEGLWSPPVDIEIQGQAKTVVSFQVAHSGLVSVVAVAESSGNARLDQMAESTIKRLGQVPPIPENFPDEVLQVSYEFVYQGQ